MTTHIGWREQYRTALLELCVEELPARIDDAEKVINQRIIELRQDDCDSHAELRELDDALYTLRILASTECKSPNLIPSMVISGEVAS
jgi:hypothetical protein